jgi:hypothetical protein
LACSSASHGAHDAGGDGGVPTDGGADAGSVCMACRADGESCRSSVECHPGSLCNFILDDFYDPSQPNDVCIKVLCSSDLDCTAPETCSLARICQAPSCWSDTACPQGQICSSGGCSPPVPARLVIRCAVLTAHAIVRPGRGFPLSVLAFDAAGNVLDGVGFGWSSTSTAVASVSGQEAVGGPSVGTATLAASVLGSGLRCDGAAIAVNVGDPTGTRFIVVASDTYEPLAGARVTLLPGPTTATTSALGTVDFANVHAIDSVSVVRAGFASVTVLALGPMRAYELALPRELDPTMAAGFTGSADLAKTTINEVAIGFAGSALQLQTVDLGLRQAFCEATTEIVDAPSLNITMQPMSIPAGGVLSISSAEITASTGGATRRCRSFPAQGQVGCYDAPANPGVGAAWAAAGQMRLADLVSLDSHIGSSSMLCDGAAEFLPDAVIYFSRHMWHGVAQGVRYTAAPRIRRPNSTSNCGDATLASYDAVCQGDFSKFTPLDLLVDSQMDIYAEVQVPPLPAIYSGGPCFEQVVLIASASLPVVGLIPLGFGGGLDGGAHGMADCLVDGQMNAFGASNVTLPQGTLPLVYAHPHSGLDRTAEERVVLTAVALSRPAFSATKPLALATISTVPTTSIGPSARFPHAFLDLPMGAIDTENAQALLSPPAGADMLEIQLRAKGKTWIVYAPGATARVDFSAPLAAGVPVQLRSVSGGFIRAIALARGWADWGTYFALEGSGYFGSPERAFLATSVRECRTGDPDCTLR